MNTLQLRNIDNIIEGKVIVEEIDRCYYRKADDSNLIKGYDIIIGLKHSNARFMEHYDTLEETKRRYGFIISLIENEIPGIRAMTFPGVY